MTLWSTLSLLVRARYPLVMCTLTLLSTRLGFRCETVSHSSISLHLPTSLLAADAMEDPVAMAVMEVTSETAATRTGTTMALVVATMEMVVDTIIIAAVVAIRTTTFTTTSAMKCYDHFDNSFQTEDPRIANYTANSNVVYHVDNRSNRPYHC